MSGRLDVISSLIVPARVIADVGCDHALIAKYCADSGLAERVVASDISEKCLQKARDLLDYADNVAFTCCNGLGYDCDEAVIAGMGGLLISEILRTAKALPKTVILCPHRDEDCVRTALIALGYGIDADIPITDRGRFYSVMRAVQGGGRRNLDKLQILFGADCGQANPVLRARLKKLYATYMRAPRQNAERLKNVVAAMLLQGIAPDSVT